MKFVRLIYPLSALLLILPFAYGANTSPTVTTTFSNLQGSNGEKSSVVFSYVTGKPILKNTGYVAIGTFKLNHAEISQLSTAAALDAAFYQFGEGSDFNALEDGAFQCDASGNPDQAFDGLNSFSGSNIYVVIGNGESLITSSEYLVWDSGVAFDNTGPVGGAWEVFLSVSKGTLLIGLDNQHTSDFSLIGGDSEAPAFTTAKIDGSLDDHGDSMESSTVVLGNSNTSAQIEDADDEDYFRIDLSDDGNLFLKLTGDLKPQITLYDSEGDVIEVIQDSGDGLNGGVAADYIISKDLAAGTYFVSVAGSQNTDIGEYSLESVFQVKIIDMDPECVGTYYGAVTDMNDKPIGRLRISISQDGVFSGKLDSFNRSKRFFKSFVDPDYSGAAATRDVWGKSSTIRFSITIAESGLYQISGHYQNLQETQPKHFFSLSQRIYDGSNPTPRSLRGRYTMLLPSSSVNDVNRPAGDGYATGSLWSSGVVKYVGYSNSGSKFSSSCPMLDGDYVTFYARPRGGLEAMVGNLWFRSEVATDFTGSVSYRRKGSSDDYYREKFSIKLVAEGSKYRKPGNNELPINGISVGNDNAIAKFLGSGLGGVNYSLTWLPDGQMYTSPTPLYAVTAVLNNKTGLVTGEFVVSVTEQTSVVTYLRGVVLQKQNRISGQAATIDGPVDRYFIVPAN